MAAVPILNGVYVNLAADFTASYPINREPVYLKSGLSNGFLRPATGVRQLSTGPGADRGGIEWNGTCYRVMGNQLVSISAVGAITQLGTIPGAEVVQMDYSFDRLAINAVQRLYYYQDGAITEVTDPDLGPVIDMIWIDGYFMTTDGEFLVVTELLDPTQVDPLKYGSSEESPDPITGLMKLRGEPYALNRYTIEVFNNVAGTGFPYQRVPSALIEKGCVGPRAKAYIADTFAFVGGGRNEAVGVYAAGAGTAKKLSTSIIDDELAMLTATELYNLPVEARIDSDEQRLLIHLPNRTLVYYVNASQQTQQQVWGYLASGPLMDQPYLPRNATWCYSQWIVGDKNGRVGVYDPKLSTFYGEVAGWQFDTILQYNESSWAILGSLELVGTPGHGGAIFCSSTTDGATWSLERQLSAGAIGQRDFRMAIRPNRRFSNWLGMRFRGADDGFGSYARLECDFEALG